MRAAFGLDRDGIWWLYLEGYYWAHCKYEGCLKKEGDGEEDNWFNSVAKKIGKAIVPILSAAAAVLVPGVGGILIGAAINAQAQIAQGGKVTDAVVAATRNALPSLLGSEEFNKASDLLKRNVPSSVLAAAKAKLQTPQQRSAFDSAVIFENARRAQLAAVAAMQKTYPRYTDKIQYAFDNGAQVVDIAKAFGGDSGVVAMNKTIEQTPKVGAGNGGGSGGGDGVGVGTLAVLGGAGFLAVKFGPHIMSSLFNGRGKR